MPVLALLMALSLTVASGCRATGRSPQLEGAVQHDSVAQVLARHTERLMALPGVVGTAESTCGGRPCILVLVARKTPELEGIPVEVRETGPIRALDSG